MNPVRFDYPSEGLFHDTVFIALSSAETAECDVIEHHVMAYGLLELCPMIPFGVLLDPYPNHRHLGIEKPLYSRNDAHDDILFDGPSILIIDC